MIDVSDIVKAFTDMLNSNADFISELYTGEVYRGDYVNMDPDRTPWAGVYKGTVSFEPRTLGSINNWEAKPNIRLIIQTTDLASAEKCEDALNALIKKAVDVVNDDMTLKNTVDMVVGFNVEYGYIETELDTLHFQSAIVTFETEVATQ